MLSLLAAFSTTGFLIMDQIIISHLKKNGLQTLPTRQVPIGSNYKKIDNGFNGDNLLIECGKIEQIPIETVLAYCFEMFGMTLVPIYYYFLFILNGHWCSYVLLCLV